jgi:hypothetical protein
MWWQIRVTARLKLMEIDERKRQQSNPMMRKDVTCTLKLP